MSDWVTIERGVRTGFMNEGIIGNMLLVGDSGRVDG